MTCLNAQAAKLFHMGIRGHVRRSTLADANERLYAALGLLQLRDVDYSSLPPTQDFKQRHRTSH